jgi:hypothetical protein
MRIREVRAGLIPTSTRTYSPMLRPEWTTGFGRQTSNLIARLLHALSSFPQVLGEVDRRRLAVGRRSFSTRALISCPANCRCTERVTETRSRSCPTRGESGRAQSPIRQSSANGHCLSAHTSQGYNPHQGLSRAARDFCPIAGNAKQMQGITLQADVVIAKFST